MALAREDLEAVCSSEVDIDLILSKLLQLKQDAENASLLFALRVQQDCLNEEGVDTGTAEAFAFLGDECRIFQASIYDRSYAEMLDHFNVSQLCQEQLDFEIALR